MRSPLIPTSLIVLVGAALCASACGDSQTDPGGSGAAGSPATPTAGSGTGAAAGSSAMSTAGTSGGAAGSTTMGTAGSGTSTGTAGMSATAGGGAAGMGTAGMAAAAGGGAAGMDAASMEPTFTRVFDEIFLTTGCAAPGSCHGSAQGPSKLGLGDQMEAYDGLVGVMAMGMPTPGDTSGIMTCMGTGIERVKAGDPDNSLLVQKLENKQTCGAQMPPGGMLKPDQIKLVRDWIMAGAKND